jgi:hypothetical protein
LAIAGDFGRRERGLNVIKLSLLCLVAGLLCAPVAAQGMSWRIDRSAWSAADEDGYSHFIQRIGESGCGTPNDCINSSANPLRGLDDRDIDFDADCADLIYMLRAYYAWKKGLPFTFTTGITSSGPGPARLSAGGNRASGRRTVRDGENALSVLNAVRHGTSSAMFRIGPGADEAPPSDFYPVKIQRGSIRPGTAIYDPNGHVALVYKVGDDGRIHYMDSHPDFTLSRSVYGAQFGRDLPELGGGFKNFRPFQIINSQAAMATNGLIADYSHEQYFGTAQTARHWQAARFMFEGVEASYYEFVRLRMAKGPLTFDPVTELHETLRTLCNDLYDRQKFVERAITAGMDRKEHPSRLPANIYGSTNEAWETYSTPSRDARLKAAFAALKGDMSRLIQRYNNRDPRIRYIGLDLEGDLLRAYERSGGVCITTYVNSAGTPVRLRLPEVKDRLFALSFNPYDCIERRWGASTPAELASCANTAAEERWYAAQQGLRNQVDRDYSARTDFSVQELEAGGPGTGPQTPPDIDVITLIKSIRMRPVMDDSKKSALPAPGSKSEPDQSRAR